MSEERKPGDPIFKSPSDVRLTVSEEKSDALGIENSPGVIAYEFGLKPAASNAGEAAADGAAAADASSANGESVSNEARAAGAKRESDDAPQNSAPILQGYSPAEQNSGPSQQRTASDQPAAPTREDSAIREYEYEAVERAIHTIIDKALNDKAKDVAEIASRLLMDVSERRVSPDEARGVLKSLADSLSAQARPPMSAQQRAKNVRRLLVGCVSGYLMMLVFAGFLNMMMTAGDRHRTTTTSSGIQPFAWQYLPLDQVGKIKSLNGAYATRFSITNELTRPVELYWLNYSGEPVLYMTLNPGETRDQPTYASHPWLVRDDTHNLLLFEAGAKEMERVVVK